MVERLFTLRRSRFGSDWKSLMLTYDQIERVVGGGRTCVINV